MSYAYRLLYRPPSFATLPPGWMLLERPRGGHGFERRTDLPLSKFEFGVVGYELPLSEEEVRAYQLEPLGETPSLGNAKRLSARGGSLTAKKPPVRKVREIQKHLFDYLSIELDPFDFPLSFFQEWAEEAGVEVHEDDDPGSLTKEQLEAYETWLRDKEKGIEWIQQDPFGSAPYLTLHWPKRMPAGTWAIHFTDDIFDAFEKGAELYGLHLSTWRKNWESLSDPKKKIVDCVKNLNPDESPYGTIWGFAFEALSPRSRQILSYGKKYGRNAVLFQTDGAVQAYHDGDEEYQLIFPVCSEYNVVPLADPEAGAVGCTLQGGDEVRFDSLQDLINYLEKDGERKVSERIRTLDC